MILTANKTKENMLHLLHLRFCCCTDSLGFRKYAFLKKWSWSNCKLKVCMSSQKNYNQNKVHRSKETEDTQFSCCFCIIIFFGYFGRVSVLFAPAIVFQAVILYMLYSKCDPIIVAIRRSLYLAFLCNIFISNRRPLCGCYFCC